MISTVWADRFATVNGVRLHYVEAGSGPLVVLLHGFPEFWYSWRHQIPVLAQAGFRVLAPDLRGYNLSNKPRGVANYRIDLLVGDVAGLIAHAGERDAIVVGHDWGGAIAWETALRRPDVVCRLIVLNCPHPAAMARGMRSPRQLLRSWYMFFFQLPWLPEAALRAENYEAIRRKFREDPVRKGAFRPEDLREYRNAIGRPGALTSAINYYRAAARFAGSEMRRERARISAPSLLIWGEQDRYLGTALVEESKRLVPQLRVERIPNASHWVQVDAPERVNRAMLEFCAP